MHFYPKISANLNSNLLKSEDNILFGGVTPPKPICGRGQLSPQEKSQFTRLQCKSYAWKLPKTFFYNSYINLTILTYFSCLCHIPPLRVHIYASDDYLILGNLQLYIINSIEQIHKILLSTNGLNKKKEYIFMCGELLNLLRCCPPN